MYTKKYRRTKVFISYSHKDSKWLTRLHEHLAPLVRDNIIEIWDDTKIRAGAIWGEEIKKAIGSAKVAVLLISKSFLASDFINSVELPPLLSAAEKEGAVILPLIIGHCMFDESRELSQFQSVNPPSKPLVSMSETEQDALFVTLCREIQSALPAPPHETRQRELAPRQLNLDGFAYPRPKWLSRDEEEDLKEMAKAAFVLAAFERTSTGCWGKTYLYRLKANGDRLPLAGGALTGTPFAVVGLHSYVSEKAAPLLKEWTYRPLTETLTSIRMDEGYKHSDKASALGNSPNMESERHAAGGGLVTLLLGNYGPRDEATLKWLCGPLPKLIPYDEANVSRFLLQACYEGSVAECLRKRAARRHANLLKNLVKCGKQSKASYYIWSEHINESQATYQWGAAWYLLPSIVAPQVPPDMRQALESLLREFLRAQSAAETTGIGLLPQSIDEAGRGWGKQVFGSTVALVCWRTLECYALGVVNRSRVDEARMYARTMVRRLINSSSDVLELPCTKVEGKPLEGYLGWAGVCLASATLGIRLHRDDCRKGLDLIEELTDPTYSSLSQEGLMDKYQELIKRKKFVAPATRLLIARCAAQISLLYRFVQRE
jgi:hypothetical protein